MLNRGELEGRFDAGFYSPLNVKISYKFPSKQLRQIVTTFSGGTPNTSNFDFWNGNIPWASSKDFKGFYLTETEDYITELAVEKSSAKIAPANSVLVVVRSGILIHTFPVSVNLDEVAINQDIKALIPNSEISGKYLGYYFVVFNRYVLSQTVKHSTTVQSVNTFEFERLQIPIPPIEIQDQIVEKLDNAYAEKKAKEAEAEKLLASVDGLILDALGITLPEAEENTLDKRIFFTKSSEISSGRFDPDALHPERIEAIKAVQSSNYEVKNLRSIANFVRILTFEKPPNLTYIGLENIQSNTGIYLPKNEVEEFGTANVFEKGQVLFPKLRPYLNKVFHANFSGVCSTEFYVLDGVEISNDYLACFLRTNLIVAQTKRLMTGNTLPRLQTKDVESLQIPIPPPEVQAKIAEKVEAIYAEAKLLREEAKAILSRAKADVERMILGES